MAPGNRSIENKLDKLEKEVEELKKLFNEMKDKNMPMGTVSIDEDRYEELLESHVILQKLHEHGVDNWEGYSEAMREFYDEEIKK